MRPGKLKVGCFRQANGTRLNTQSLERLIKYMILNCIFCEPDKLKHQFPNSAKCNRWIFNDENSYAVLTPQQYTIGHTLVISKIHTSDITEISTSKLFINFLISVNKVAFLLKKKVKNKDEISPDNVYVNILYDGVKHLHAHLIPRYPFTINDKKRYRKVFKERD